MTTMPDPNCNTPTLLFVTRLVCWRSVMHMAIQAAETYANWVKHSKNRDKNSYTQPLYQCGSLKTTIITNTTYKVLRNFLCIQFLFPNASKGCFFGGFERQAQTKRAMSSSSREHRQSYNVDMIHRIHNIIIYSAVFLFSPTFIVRCERVCFCWKYIMLPCKRWVCLVEKFGR